MLYTVSVVCADGCFVYMQYLRPCLYFVVDMLPCTVVCTSDLWLDFSNYTHVVVFNYWPNVIHATIENFI